MNYKIGDTVQILANSMVGTVVYFDENTSKYLVRFGAEQQLYYSENEIKLFM